VILRTGVGDHQQLQAFQGAMRWVDANQVIHVVHALDGLSE